MSVVEMGLRLICANAPSAYATFHAQNTVSMTAKTLYLVLNIFDLLHDRHGCECTVCGLLTVLTARTRSTLSWSRQGTDGLCATLDGNDVVVALTNFDENALIAARAVNALPCAWVGKICHGQRLASMTDRTR